MFPPLRYSNQLHSQHGPDPWVDRGTFPLLFEVEGTPCVLSPYLFGGRHFCTNAHGIHWIIGPFFVKFSQLIPTKIIKIVATRRQILRPKSIKFNFGWASAPDPAGGAYSAPSDPMGGFNGATSRGRGEKGYGVDGWEGSRLLFSADIRP